MTTDYKKAADFYGALFGWRENGSMDMGNGEMYSLFGHDETMYGGMYNRTSEMGSVPPFWLLYINVKDVAKAVTTATKAGATVVRPRLSIPGGTIAILTDPQGAAFAVHDIFAAAPPAATTAPAKKSAAKKSAAKKAVGKAKKAVASAKAAVGGALRKAAKAVKGAVKKVKAKAAPAKGKAKARAAKPITKAKAAVKRARPKAKAAARKVVAKTRSKAKVVAKKAAPRRRTVAKRKR
jgi:predicted enzyme related to lactoylglutathione lyase